MGNPIIECLLRFYTNNFCWWYANMRNTFLYLVDTNRLNRLNRLNQLNQNRHNVHETHPDETGKFKLNYHIYDISNDIIKLRYFVANKEHKICVPRSLCHNNMGNINGEYSIKQIYDEISSKNSHLRQMLEYPILDATLNDGVDLTERLCQYLGHQGSHMIYGHGIKIKWILTPHEIPEFEKLTVLTDKCKTITYTHTDDTILL